MRPILALVAGAAVAAFGAAVLGEYSFAGAAVIGSGALLGLFVAEAVLWVRGEEEPGTWPVAAAAALLTAAGLVMAAWIATGHRVGEVRWDGWLAVALGAVVAGFRLRPGGRRRTPAAPRQTP